MNFVDWCAEKEKEGHWNASHETAIHRFCVCVALRNEYLNSNNFAVEWFIWNFISIDIFDQQMCETITKQPNERDLFSIGESVEVNINIFKILIEMQLPMDCVKFETKLKNKSVDWKSGILIYVITIDKNVKCLWNCHSSFIVKWMLCNFIRFSFLHVRCTHNLCCICEIIVFCVEQFQFANATDTFPTAKHPSIYPSILLCDGFRYNISMKPDKQKL